MSLVSCSAVPSVVYVMGMHRGRYRVGRCRRAQAGGYTAGMGTGWVLYLAWPDYT